MIGDDPCQISCVDDEQDRFEDWTLWYATDDIRNTGTAASTVNERGHCSIYLLWGGWKTKLTLVLVIYLNLDYLSISGHLSKY